MGEGPWNMVEHGCQVPQQQHKNKNKSRGGTKSRTESRHTFGLRPVLERASLGKIHKLERNL